MNSGGAKHIVVIGAGACGLMAARELARAGLRVTVLEGRARTGGRIWTRNETSFGVPHEAGAEFIHGNLSLTHRLLSEYGIKTNVVKGDIWRVNEEPEKESTFIVDHNRQLSNALKKLSEDISVEEFLEKNFQQPKYAQLVNEVRGFVQGYDCADTFQASAAAFKDEWLHVPEEQYRVEGGYSRLTNALAAACESFGCNILLEHLVHRIKWKRGSAEIQLVQRKSIHADKVIITLPLGVLKTKGETGSVDFDPPLPAHARAFQELGYGTVIKFFLRFDEAFWNSNRKENKEARKIRNMGFLFSDTRVPTWWTQLPDESPVLTGWLGGPHALLWQSAHEDTLLDIALESLAAIFKEKKEYISARLTAWRITDWGRDLFSRGAYSYKTVGAEPLLALLRTPVENTLYFAGEALSEEGTGTVDAALASGLSVSEKALGAL
ncbi:MAG TPA: NAD(P)/FAD-dependent oxidoreductase [Bacteroidia bacterium]|nr:NAD(P)/FAD-dependent oxidoreductase [Bacteroidia bacterium]